MIVFFARRHSTPDAHSRLSGESKRFQFNSIRMWHITPRNDGYKRQPNPLLCMNMQEKEIMQRVNFFSLPTVKMKNNIVIHFINVSDMSFFFIAVCNPMMRLFPDPVIYAASGKIIRLRCTESDTSTKRFSWNLLKSTWNIHITLHLSRN